MIEEPPVLEGPPPTGEQQRLVALFDEMEKQQVDFLDQAGKRIIELTTGLLGVLFAVTAFGDKFPPPYLQGNNLAKALAMMTLALYLAAMVTSVRAIRPRKYRRYAYNLTGMRQVLEEIIGYKSRGLKVAGSLFVLGSLALALLISAIIFAA